MHIRSIASLLVVWMAIADVGHAAEAVKQDPAVPAAERPSEARPAPAAAPAQKGKPPGELVFEPPPVPDFMLKKPAKPLTLEEMKRQADEAAERSRRAREARQAGSPAPGANSGTAGEAPAQPKM